MQPQRIYFDNAATTPLYPEVSDHMYEISKTVFANPSSIHAEGRIARSFIEDCRKQLAEYLQCALTEVFFTSCGTESNNIILHGCITSLGVNHVITTAIEHPNVINPLLHFAKQGIIKLTFLPIDIHGNISLEDLEQCITEHKGYKNLVSLMHVNNELGTQHPIAEIGNICKREQVLFHSDTVQGIGFNNYPLHEMNVDFISGSAHKFYGPKGIGFMYIRQGLQISPFMLGGSQERNMRSGTENIIGIAGLTRALHICMQDIESRVTHLNALHLYMRNNLKRLVPNIAFNTPAIHYSPKILNAHFSAFDGSDLLPVMLDIAGISISGGSACTSGTEKPSHVIEKTRPGDLGKSIRFSFSHWNTKEEIDLCTTALQKLVHY